VVDELIERKAVTKDIKAIGNISDIPVQHRVMTLIRDEKELKQLYANTPNSSLSTSSANLDITSMPSGAPIDIILPLNPTSLELSTL
jgi:hypothetical protein